MVLKWAVVGRTEYWCRFSDERRRTQIKKWLKICDDWKVNKRTKRKKQEIHSIPPDRKNTATVIEGRAPGGVAEGRGGRDPQRLGGGAKERTGGERGRGGTIGWSHGALWSSDDREAWRGGILWGAHVYAYVSCELTTDHETFQKTNVFRKK